MRSSLVALAAPPARKAAQQQVVLDRHLAEQLALFGHQRHAVATMARRSPAG
jgi:hypothetical protein